MLQPQHTVQFDRKLKSFEDDQYSAKIHKKNYIFSFFGINWLYFIALEVIDSQLSLLGALCFSHSTLVNLTENSNLLKMITFLQI